MKRPSKPAKKGVIQFAIFNLGGAMFFIVGYLTFVLLYGVFHWPWLPAKIVADFLGWLTNFVVQYFWAFREETKGQHARTITTKFTGFSLINLVIDYAIVAILAWIGITPFIGLIVAASFFTIWKWLWYKRWVFRIDN